MSAAQVVTLGTVEYTVSPLTLKVLRKNWKRLLALVLAVLSLLRSAKTLSSGLMEGGGSEEFQGAAADLVEKLSEDQIDLLLDLVHESLAVTAPKTFTREAFEDLVTMDKLPELAIAFVAAQGIKFGKEETVSGEAAGDPTPT